ncbi:MAG: electron transport complex subunit RsxG [Gammaproteobacteria bacterium]
MFLKNMSINAIVLGIFALTGTIILAYTDIITKPKIEAEQRHFLLRSLNILVPEDQRDNDIFNDVIYVTAPNLLGSTKPVAIYRARMKSKPVAVIINSLAPDGYNGKIYLLVAINNNGELAGVRVSKHIETPGLGDGIDIRKSDWILQFVGKSLANTSKQLWAVKKDGGQFDEFTGATITPRAVVKAIQNTLLYFKANRDNLFKIQDKTIRSESENKKLHIQIKNFSETK